MQPTVAPFSPAPAASLSLTIAEALSWRLLGTWKTCSDLQQVSGGVGQVA